MMKKIAVLVLASAMFGGSASAMVSVSANDPVAQNRWGDVISYCKQFPRDCYCDPDYTWCTIK